MRLNGRISGFSYFCVVPTALGSLIPRYPALKRWARLRRPVRGLCFYHVLGYRDNVASRLGKSKTPTSAKKGQMFGSQRHPVIMKMLCHCKGLQRTPRSLDFALLRAAQSPFARDDNF